MSKDDDVAESEEVLQEGSDEELVATTATVQASNSSGKSGNRPLSPPPPPPPPPPLEPAEYGTDIPDLTIQRSDTSDSIHLTGSLSNNFAYDIPPSLNSSMASFGTDLYDDMPDFVSVDDETTLDLGPLMIVADPMRTHVSASTNNAARDRSSSPIRHTRKSLPAASNQPARKFAYSPYSQMSQMSDSFTLDGDSFHESHINTQPQRADSSPIKPMRGTSICSVDSESIAANVKQPYVYMNPSQTHKKNRNNYNNHQSFGSSAHSMWEDSWTTFATMDNSHHKVHIIHEIVEEEQQSLAAAPLPGVNKAAEFQQMSLNNQGLSTPARAPTTSRKQSPCRSSSRNSHYSSFSSLDASAMKRSSRSQRIRMLKRRSSLQNMNAAQTPPSPLSTMSKSNHSHESRTRSNSLPSIGAESQNSTKPQRRPTKLLPRDEEAETEPTSFFMHSESQLSLTSSDEEGDEDEIDHICDSDRTPKIPGRRISEDSFALYETESAALRLTQTYDTPLSAPLRRTSTLDGSTLDPTAIVECDDEGEGDDKETGSRNQSLHESPSSPFEISSIHLRVECPEDELPVTSIHMPSHSSCQGPDVDHVPTLPSRQRSVGKAAVKEEWLKQNEHGGSHHAMNGRGTSEAPPSATDDFKPSLPKRQSTFNNNEAKRRFRGDFVQGEEKENNSVAASNSSTSTNQPENASNPYQIQQASGMGYQGTLSDDAAPNPPTRQRSASTRSRCISPTPEPTISSASALGVSGQSVLQTEEGLSEQSAGEDKDRLLAGNDIRERDRHDTRGKSLRSAAASLQKRVSNPTSEDATTAVSEVTVSMSTELLQHLKMLSARDLSEQLDASGDDSNAANKQDVAAKASSTQASPTTDFEELKILKEETVRGLSDQLDCLQLDPSIDISNDDSEIPTSSDVPDIPPNTKGSSATAANEFDVTNNGSISNHSTSSAWTSASKEFEYLKMMNNDTVASLETQLQILEEKELELCMDVSAGDLSMSRSSLTNGSWQTGSDRFGRVRTSDSHITSIAESGSTCEDKRDEASC